MKNKPQKKSGAAARKGRPESPQSKKTFSRRTARPGEVGLANETRPGLGTRGRKMKSPPKKTVGQDADPLGRNAPLIPREPREQKAGSLGAELERATVASGQMGH